jgi:hypothetical protein
MHKRAYLNIALYGAFAALAVSVYHLTATFPRPLLPGYPGSAMFPRFIVTLMGIFALWGMLGEAYKLLRAAPSSGAPVAAKILADGQAGEGDDPPVTFGSFVLVICALAAFVGLTEWAGMEVGIGVFTSAMIYFVTRSAMWSLISGVCSVLVVYFLFVQGLSVFLPLTFLPRYLTW